ncbi:MAG: DUF6064 family protein [Desulfocucumaceae bacterium]
MKIPFTVGQFLAVFEDYNLAIWPLQVFAYLMAVAVVYLVVKKTRHSGRIAFGVLSLFWIWVGGAYHISYFSAINKAAYIFGALFVIQGILFLAYGVFKPGIAFRPGSNIYTLVGFAFMLYAMVIYPILGYMQGHGYPQSPVFGVAPCPVTIFTFGLLLMAEKVPKHILVIPLIWSVIGFSAAVSMGIREDFGLFAAGLVGSSMIILKGKLPGMATKSYVPRT